MIFDIKQQTFSNAWIGEEGWDYIGFWWFKYIFCENPQIPVYRFLQIVFGLICSSSYLLNANANPHASRYFTKWKYFVDKFLRDLYVNDSLSRSEIVFTAYDFYIQKWNQWCMMRDLISKLGLKFLTINAQDRNKLKTWFYIHLKNQVQVQVK